MKKVMLVAMCLVVFMTLSAQEAYVSKNLTKKWESPAQLKVPESAQYDASHKVIFVSNVNGSPTEKDGNGFISKLSPDGKIISLEWVTGLDAPKGIGIKGNYLYVADITRVVKVDIAQGKILEKIEIPGSKFLNDIAIDNDGNVYVSDMNDHAVYVLKNDKYELLVKSDKLNGPNGLYAEGDYLLAGLQDRVVTINLKTKEIKDFILNTGGIDGLVPDGKGNYFISDWLGHVYLAGTRTDKVKLLDTTPLKMNAADIDYVIEKRLLLVPTFNDNRVIAYEVK